MGVVPTVYVDAMGGDNAPAINVEGALDALSETKAQIVLVGDKAQIRPILDEEAKKHKNFKLLDRISIEHTTEYITMDDHPSTAVRKKRDASLNIAMKLAAEDANSAFLSAGNSGAALASGVMHMKRIPGVERPAIAATLPTIRSFFLLVDAGANTQCRASQLVQFALLGSQYYQVNYPGTQGKIGVLSNGGEDSKGTELTRETVAILRKIEAAGLIAKGTFAGNVEGKEVFQGDVDVVVCDGFTGNILLKGLEGLATAVIDIMKLEIKKDLFASFGMLFAMRAIKRVKNRMDYAEVGGAPLLGVNGHAFIAHGGSTRKAIKNAIRVAADAATSDLPSALSSIIEKTKPYIAPQASGAVTGNEGN